jgi:hypothetical protein
MAYKYERFNVISKIPRLDILGKLLPLLHYHVSAGDEIHSKENIYNLRE